jgi:hypothetical protein
MNAGSFSLLAPALLLAASVASAQQPLPPPPSVPPAPAVTVPNPFAGSHPAGPDLYQSPDGSDRFAHGAQYPAPPPIVVPPIYIPGPYGPYYPYHPQWRPGDYVSYYPKPQHVVSYGALALETIPDSAEVFVDGYYVGLAEEFGFQGRPLSLTAGPHRVELRAAGYETSSFNVMIDPDNILRYRGDMRLVSTGPAIVVLPQPAGPRTLYVIPKCYAGDKPPTGALPPGCDRKNLQTHK